MVRLPQKRLPGARRVCVIGASCGLPLPRLRVLHAQKPVQAKDDGMMLKVINCAFHMRRKKLTNNLKAVFSIDQEKAAAALAEAGIDVNVRGEALEIAELARLSDVLTEMIG